MLGHMSDSLTGLLADAELAASAGASRATPGPLVREPGPRAMREAQRNRVMARPRGPELAVVEDLAAADGVAVRLYRPASGPHPLVVFLHGGCVMRASSSPAGWPPRECRSSIAASPG